MNSAKIIEFCRELIACPTALDDDSGTRKLTDLILHNLSVSGIKAKTLIGDDGNPTAIVALIGNQDLPSIVLNACGDTAPIGDIDDWSTNPLAGEVVDGWMYGRGVADSKIAISIFSEILISLSKNWSSDKISLSLLIDLDEHTGGFGGVKSFINTSPKVYGMYIGYPGNDYINIGARGVYRNRIKINGIGQHSGSSADLKANAILAASELVERFSEIDLSSHITSGFPKNPKLTVTDIEARGYFTSIPSSCVLGIDIRLTPGFDSKMANKIIENTLDLSISKPFEYEREIMIDWPPYMLPNDTQFVKHLAAAANEELENSVTTRIVGPSNIGNYLFGKGINATCGFGVNYKNIHAADECIELSSIDRVFTIYQNAILKMI